MANLKQFLRVQKAAGHLGVSASTVRNWERDGKLRAHRHPSNAYRLFDPLALDDLLRKDRKSARPRRRTAGRK